jgi:hypothetical protein
VDLNTIEAIVSLAFRHGRGHSSVYDFSRKDFATMVDKHVRDVKGIFKTELSSWTESLLWAIRYALRCLGGDTNECYISMIDTKRLWEQNQIFFVPDLHFLSKDLDLEHYQFEYLAHGCIRGPHHYAIPVSTLQGYGYNVEKISLFNTEYSRTKAKAITAEMVEQARVVGVFFGPDLTLPMILTLLCIEGRRLRLFNQDEEEMQVLLDGLAGVQFPHERSNDSTIMRDDVFTGDDKKEHYPDLRQFIHLMRDVVSHGAKHIASQSAGWTEKQLLRIGGTSNSNGVTFNSHDDTRLFKKDDVLRRQPEISGGYTTGSRKRDADFDEEMPDVDEQTEESMESKKNSRAEHELKRLRRDMNDEGKAREVGHYGNDDGGVGKRRA